MRNQWIFLIRKGDKFSKDLLSVLLTTMCFGSLRCLLYIEFLRMSGGFPLLLFLLGWLFVVFFVFDCCEFCFVHLFVFLLES